MQRLAVGGLVLFGLVLLGSCGPGESGDPELYGMALELQLTQHNSPWVERADLKPRTRTVIEESAAYWGLNPDDLAGWHLLFTEGLLECGGHDDANGCTTDGDRTVSVTANYACCVESSVLMHEIGHVALDDPRHEDPRWHDVAALTGLWNRLHAGLPAAPDCGGEPYLGQWQGF
jgi:hypothetical protein